MHQQTTTALQNVCALADTIVAAVLLAAVLTIGNLQSMPHGVASFLEARITLANAVLAAIFLAVWHFLFDFVKAYDAVPGRPFADEARKLFAACSLGSLAVLVFPAFSRTHAFSWSLAPVFWIVATAATIGIHAALRTIASHSGRRLRDVLIVGSGPRAADVYRNITENHTADYRFVGFVDNPNAHYVPDEVRRGLLGSLDHLDRILMNRVVDHVLIALPVKSCYDDIQRTIAVCEQAGVESEYLADAFQPLIARPQRGNLDARPLVRYKVVTDDYRLVIKRLIDLVGAATGLILFSPVMLAIAIAIRLTSRGPVFFTQQRYGLNKRRFPMYKFRTMVPDAEAMQRQLESRNEATGPVFKIHNDPRVTPLGRLLRRSSLDELPQLFNVLRGEMSLVGPRPLPQRDVSKFESPSLMRRFSVKPGLTCLWQISGRSDTSFDRWVELDLKYIDTWSLSLDIRIVLLTFPAIVVGRGAA